MAYRLTANRRGGYHVSDDQTLIHAEVKSAEQAARWFAAQDAKKLADWQAKNAAPIPDAQPTVVPEASVAADVQRSN